MIELLCQYIIRVFLRKARIHPVNQIISTIITGGAFMRLQHININPSRMKLEIDIMEQKGCFAIIVCDGKGKITQLPVHGETKIVTHQGKVKRVKFDEGEEF